MLGSRCVRCEAPRVLRAAISDERGIPNDELAPLEQLLLRDPTRSAAVIKWVRRGSTARVLSDMARKQKPVSLRTVAKEPATAGSAYLAALLIESGTVPSENYDRVRLEVWEEAYFQDIVNLEHRALLRTYARWAVNRLFSDDANLAVPDQGHRFSRSRGHIVAVHHFLSTVSDLGYDLNTLPQAAFDEYVVATNTSGRDLTKFIRWCHRRGLTSLSSHYAQAAYAPSVVSETLRWRWIECLCTDENISLPSRVAGLLTMTYGIPITRILALRRDDVIDDGTHIMVRFARDPVTLASSITPLMRRLMAMPMRVHADVDLWVFRGVRAGHHLTPSAVTQPLRSRGMRVGPARTAAILGLSRDAPASVIADLLGISIEAVERWSKVAGRAWVDYPALRSEGPTRPTEGSRRREMGSIEL
jgi:hypothetical protein